MPEFLKTVLIIFGFFGVAAVLLNIKTFFNKGELKSSCASNNPLLRDQFGNCTVCGNQQEADCDLPKVSK